MTILMHRLGIVTINLSLCPGDGFLQKVFPPDINSNESLAPTQYLERRGFRVGVTDHHQVSQGQSVVVIGQPFNDPVILIFDQQSNSNSSSRCQQLVVRSNTCGSDRWGGLPKRVWLFSVSASSLPLASLPRQPPLILRAVAPREATFTPPSIASSQAACCR